MTGALSRRALLGLGAGALLAPALAGCSPGARGSGDPDVPAGCPSYSRAADVTALLARPRFLVAHRGSGDNWPEHTLLAYRESLAAGAAAVEISVRRTRDGVLVCHHDADTRRTTGQDLLLAETPWSRIRTLRVDARRWLGSASAPQPIPRLADVLRALPPDTLAFVEDKDGDNTAAVLRLLDAQPRATERFVWKQWAGGRQVRSAAGRGYQTWGYFTPELLDRLAELAPRFTALGVGTEQSDAAVAAVVAAGKPVLAWEVHRRSDATRLHRLGVAGMMCSNVAYLVTCQPSGTVVDFAAGLRAPGDLPSRVQVPWSSQPRIDTEAGVLRLPAASPQVYQLGSLSPVGDSYTLSTSFTWPDRTGEAGLAFCRADDAVYVPYPTARAAQGSGFRLRVSPRGRLELAEQTPGSAINGLLAALDGPPPQPGVPLPVEVAVTPGRVVLRCAGREAVANNVAPRGGYIFAWTNGAPVDLGSVTVRPGT